MHGDSNNLSNGTPNGDAPSKSEDEACSTTNSLSLLPTKHHNDSELVETGNSNENACKEKVGDEQKNVVVNSNNSNKSFRSRSHTPPRKTGQEGDGKSDDSDDEDGSDGDDDKALLPVADTKIRRRPGRPVGSKRKVPVKIEGGVGRRSLSATPCSNDDKPASPENSSPAPKSPLLSSDDDNQPLSRCVLRDNNDDDGEIKTEAVEDDGEDEQQKKNAPSRRSTRKREMLSLLTPPSSTETYQGRLRRSTNSNNNSNSKTVTSQLLTTNSPEFSGKTEETGETGNDGEEGSKTLRRRRTVTPKVPADADADVPEQPGDEDQAEAGVKRRRGGRPRVVLKRCEACGIEAAMTALRYGSGRFCSKTCVGLFANKHRHRGRRSGADDSELAGPSEASNSDVAPVTSKKRGLADQQPANGKKTRNLLSASAHPALEGTDQSNDSSESSVSSSRSFDWQAYLKETNSFPVPPDVFRNPFPTFNSSSFFQVNHRLEGIDPRHPSLFCVLSVAQVVGFRLRLHFDGFSPAHDFWTNADSPYLFPAGWTEKSGRKLQMPKGWKRSRFSWPSYLRQTNSTAAPSELFASLRLPEGDSALRRGQKLEAVDKTNTLLTCVASLADFFGDRVLIHFDGWGDTYDFWTTLWSPYLHAVGWCQDMGRALSPPQHYPDIENFTWEDYLGETNSEALPAHLFKGRPPASFTVSYKMEAVDRRNPSLLRVATVVETADYRIKIRYDGWPEAFDIYVDDDCADVHPVGWANHTGHDLEAPPTNQQQNGTYHIASNPTCPTYGCRGVGHAKGAKFTNHTSACGCPYAQPNLDRPGRNNERLSGTDSLAENASLLLVAERPNYNNSEASGKKLQSHNNNRPRISGDTAGSKTSGGGRLISRRHSSSHYHNGLSPASGDHGNRRTEMADSVRRFIFNAPVHSNGSTPTAPPILPSSLVMDRLLEAINPDLAKANRAQRQQAAKNEAEMSSSSSSSSQKDHLSAKSKLANKQEGLATNGEDKVASAIREGITPRLVATWNVQKVAEFVRSLPGCHQNSQAFADEQIDGAALLLLNQADMLKIMNMKLGPVLKIFSVLQAIKRA